MKTIPIHLVEYEILNSASNTHVPSFCAITRGLCLKETSTNVIMSSFWKFLRKPMVSLGQNRKITAILIRALPSHLTVAILAHELMHAWIHLYLHGKEQNDWKPKERMDPIVEEGCCQLVAYYYLGHILNYDYKLKEDSE